MLIKRCLIMKQYGSMYTFKNYQQYTEKQSCLFCFESSGKTFNLSVNTTFEKTKQNWRDKEFK